MFWKLLMEIFTRLNDLSVKCLLKCFSRLPILHTLNWSKYLCIQNSCLHLRLAGLIKDNTFFLNLVWTVSQRSTKHLSTKHCPWRKIWSSFFVKYILILKYLNTLWSVQNHIHKLGFCNTSINTSFFFQIFRKSMVIHYTNNPKFHCELFTFLGINHVKV